MTNVTLSVEDSVYNKMKRYSEIKWSEFVRKTIEKRIDEMEKIKKTFSDEDDIMFLADEKLLAEDWLSPEDDVWNDL